MGASALGRVVNVHSDPERRSARTVVLTAAGYEVAEAPDAPTALALAATSPDLIVLDLHLPHFHALEVLVRLRGGTVTRNIPVVVTGNPQQGCVENARAAGATAFVRQSSPGTTLVREIDAVLRPRRLSA